MKTIARNRTKAIKAILEAGTRFEEHSARRLRVDASIVTREIAERALAEGGRLVDHENGKYSIARPGSSRWVEIFTPAYGSEK